MAEGDWTVATSVDPIDFELFKNAVFSIADEMALTVFRTTYSAVLKDNMDYSTGFADGEGNVNPDLPVTRMQVALSDRGDGGTNVRITSYFATLEQLEQLVEMGMEEGLQLAMGQMDAILLDA